MKAFRDETWRLARDGDAAGLHRAAGLLSDYDGHRARAFALAVEGRLDDALAQLSENRAQDWPFPAAYAADLGRVRFLAGDYERSLAALQPAVRGVDRLDPALADLVSDVVSREPKLRLRAVKLLLTGGTIRQRLRNATAAATSRNR